ncbi:MAG: hypothetical protein ACTSSP_10415 [Candidatus Asgardarchaeia archaeon]
MVILECKCGFKTKSKISFKNHLKECNPEVITYYYQLEKNYCILAYSGILNGKRAAFLQKGTHKEIIISILNKLRNEVRNDERILIDSAENWLEEAFITRNEKYLRNSYEAISKVIDKI